MTVIYDQFKNIKNVDNVTSYKIPDADSSLYRVIKTFLTNIPSEDVVSAGVDIVIDMTLTDKASVQVTANTQEVNYGVVKTASGFTVNLVPRDGTTTINNVKLDIEVTDFEYKK